MDSRIIYEKSQGRWRVVTFCPNEAPGSPEVYGDEFEALRYTRGMKGRQSPSNREGSGIMVRHPGFHK